MAPHCIIIKSPDTVVQVVFWQEKTVNSKVKVGGALRGRKVGGRRWRDCREKSFLYCWSQQTHILNTDPYCVRFSPHPSLFWTTASVLSSFSSISSSTALTGCGGGGRLCFQEEMRETPEAELQGLTDLFTSMTHEKSKSARVMLSCVCAPVCLHVFMTKRSFVFFFEDKVKVAQRWGCDLPQRSLQFPPFLFLPSFPSHLSSWTLN